MRIFLAALAVSLLQGTVGRNCASNGASMGKLQGNGVSGEVFAVNSSTVRILGFSSQSPTTFSFDQSGPVKDIFIQQKDSLKPLGSTVPQLSGVRLVMNVPGGSIKGNQKLNVNSGSQTVASASIPASLDPPRSLNLGVGIKGWIYNVKTGPITILDAKTIILPQFSFQGNKPPDGWVFAGKYDPDDGKVHGDFGKKALVRGHDTPSSHTPLKELWDGSKTIIADLGEGQTVCDIEYIGVYCYNVGVDFGHLDLKGKITRDVPPHIPPIAL